MSQRPLLLCLILVGGALAAGCGAEGSYRVGWEFVITDPMTSEPIAWEPASVGCGLHGVDGVGFSGGNGAGDSENIVAVCSAGEIVRKLPIGRWSLIVHQLDARGVVIIADQPVPEFDIGEDALVDLGVLPLNVRTQCTDGIDNGGDGQVDIDDPDCSGDPMDNTEDPMDDTE
jgi:hypothetical protein